LWHGHRSAIAASWYRVLSEYEKRQDVPFGLLASSLDSQGESGLREGVQCSRDFGPKEACQQGEIHFGAGSVTPDLDSSVVTFLSTTRIPLVGLRHETGQNKTLQEAGENKTP